MNIKKALTSILFIAIMAMFISTVFSFAYIPTLSGLVLGSLLIPNQKGIAFMAVQVQIWQKDIIDNLFKDNQFAEKAVSGDQYVLEGVMVHIPNAGAPDKSLLNPTNFPIDAVKRTDTDIMYPLDAVYQSPKFVEKIEQAELSYDKRQSIMGEQQKQLIQDAMDLLILKWSSVAQDGVTMTPCNSILTSGAASALNLIDGATGQRKVFTPDVFSASKIAMDKANISPNGRYALLSAVHYQEFLDSLSDAARTNFYRIADISKGIVGSYLGFTVLMRSSVLRWRNTAGVWSPVNEFDPAFAASDKSSDSQTSLIWQEDCVERARGAINIFDSANRPEYYGDVFSMNMRFGGRPRRSAGVYAVVEAIVGA